MPIRFNPPSIWSNQGRPWHHGVVQPQGHVLHITGQVAWNAAGHVVGEGDAASQTRQCFDNVETILAAVGGRMEDIVSLTMFYVDPEDIPAIQAVRAERIEARHGPVSILIQAGGLVAPEFKIEVIPVAVIPDDRFHSPKEV